MGERGPDRNRDTHELPDHSLGVCERRFFDTIRGNHKEQYAVADSFVNYVLGRSFESFENLGDIPRGYPVKYLAHEDRIYYFVSYDKAAKCAYLSSRDPNDPLVQLVPNSFYTVCEEMFGDFQIMVPTATSTYDYKTARDGNEVNLVGDVLSITGMDIEPGDSFESIEEVTSLESAYDLVYYGGFLFVYGGYANQHFLLFDSFEKALSSTRPDEAVSVFSLGSLKKLKYKIR